MFRVIGHIEQVYRVLKVICNINWILNNNRLVGLFKIWINLCSRFASISLKSSMFSLFCLGKRDGHYIENNCDQNSRETKWSNQWWSKFTFFYWTSHRSLPSILDDTLPIVSTQSRYWQSSDKRVRWQSISRILSERISIRFRKSIKSKKTPKRSVFI